MCSTGRLLDNACRLGAPALMRVKEANVGKLRVSSAQQEGGPAEVVSLEDAQKNGPADNADGSCLSLSASLQNVLHRDGLILTAHTRPCLFWLHELSADVHQLCQEHHVHSQIAMSN